MATFVKKGKTIRFGDPIGVNFVQSDGNFSSDSDATVRHFILRGVTTNDTETEIFVGNNTNSRMNLITDSTWFFEVDIVARRTDSDASACWRCDISNYGSCEHAKIHFSVILCTVHTVLNS